MTVVPVFSLRKLEAAIERTPSPSAGGEQLLQAFFQCLSSTGIFYLADCDLDDDVHVAPREAVMQFFEHSSDVAKERMKVPGRRGFIALEQESLASLTNNGEFPDYSMSFIMGPRDNVFPSPEFEACWTAYYDRIAASGRRLVNVAVKLLGLPDVGEYDSSLRFRHYPDLPPRRAAESQALRIAPHYDASWFTLIHQTACPNGFISNQTEVGGAFVGIPTVPNTMVVYCGAILSIATNGLVKTPLHRVASAPLHMIEGSRRSACVMFLRPTAEHEFSLETAHRLGHALGLSGKTATLGEWLSVNDPRAAIQKKANPVKARL